MKKIINIFFISLILSGCVNEFIIPDAINKYEAVENTISLGDSKDFVLSILEPTQKSLSNQMKKNPEKFLNDGIMIEIYYFRTGWQSDGLTTDDEFTPYIFIDNHLKAIGWEILGGPKTFATGDYKRRNITSGSSINNSKGTPIYSHDECIGAVVNGVCHGSIMPKTYGPRKKCYGKMIGGNCTGPMF